VLNSKSDWPGDAQALQAKESVSQVPAHTTLTQPAAQAGAPVPPQGRRVTIGGANRRSSLGFDQINDALFGRRPSGFGELDTLFGRRGSLDSTAAAFDAHIMDLTRRRLSMAGGSNDPLASLDPFAGMGGVNLNLGNVASINSLGQLHSLQGGNAANSNNGGAPGQDPTVLNARQQQLQEQQHELERKQKELELQRQQLLAAMGERRLAMQNMHQKMQMPQNNTQQVQQAQRNALNLNNAQGLLTGLQNQGLAAAAAATNSTPDANGQQQWFVCRVCNSKAFNNREEANAHENMCMMNNAGAAAARRNSLAGMMRRSSLDLLGSLAGGPLANPSPDIFAAAQSFQPQISIPTANQTSKQTNADGNVSEHMSNGPFAVMNKPIPLAMETDKDWLTPLHCFVRKHCVEVFTAVEEDVATPSKGKRKPIQVGQVGIRCPHCHRDPSSQSRERGSVYYPTSIASIYNATMNLLQRHLHNCSAVPPEIMERYEMLKGDDARSGTSKKYWVQSAVSLGLVDTANGIRYSGVPQPTALPESPALEVGNMFKSNEERVKREEAVQSSAEAETSEAKPAAEQKADAAAAVEPASPETPIVIPEDEPYGTAFSYYLLQQMRPCVFAEADRLGKRKGLPPGFPGLACKHCFGGYGSGRFFPSSIKTLSDTSKTLNVLHNHMMRCRKVPPEIRDSLTGLRKTHDEERAKMKFGSQKAFFARIWDRLHYKDPSVSSKRKFQPARVLPQIPAQAQAVPGFLPSNFLGQPGFNMNQVNMLEALNNMQTMQQFNAAAAGDLTDSNKRPKL